MKVLTAITAIQGMAGMGVTQINEATIKDWFFKRPYIKTTGKEIKECLMEVGIKLRPCKDYIPSSYMPLPVAEEVYTELFRDKEELYDMYITRSISPSKIAYIKHCETREVYDNINKFGIDLKYGHGQPTSYKRKFKI